MSDSPTKARLSCLHTHSVYSTLDGASNIDEYIEWSKQNGASGLGLTDHGYVIGNLELVTKAQKAGLTALPGCEFYLAPDKSHQFRGKSYDYFHVTVWSVNEAGYRNLNRLASIAWNRDTLPGWAKIPKSDKYEIVQKSRVTVKFGTQQKPRITFDELLTYNEGLVLGSGCLIGTLSKCFINGEFKEAEKNLNKLLEVYNGRMFMELMPHSCDHDYSRETKSFHKNEPLYFDECTFAPDGDLQKACNEEVVKLARKYELPLLMTTDAHFVKPETKKIQDILISNGDPTGWTFYNNYHAMTTEQAWDNWKEIHGDDKEQRIIFSEAVENNDVLVYMAKDLKINDPYRQPEVQIEESIVANSNTPEEALKAHIFKQIEFHGRMKWDNPIYVDRLMMEIGVICDNGVVDFGRYFASLEEWFRWGTEHSILFAPGRGSGAGSLLCYLLKITHLDPIRYGLPFERFLSEARIKRGKFPDIDSDSGNRDLLISYLRDKYGNKMAQCSTLHTLKLKSAIKDACRSILKWNSQDPRVDAVTKTIANEPQGVASLDFLLGYKDQDGHIHDGHIMENPVLDKFFEEHPEIYDAVIKLLGVPRAISRHASAFLISDAPISESVPTCDISGYLCTQYNANAAFNAVEKAGLIKFDLLRINTLDDISGCIRLVQKKFGYKVWNEEVTYDSQVFRISKGDLPIDKLPMADGRILDMYDLPEDEKVFTHLTMGMTETVFQMNSALMTGFTKRIKPTAIKDLSDIVALVRPGPLEAATGEMYDKKPLTMTEAYILRRHGDIETKYAHPDMRPILENTYGVAVYQEQLQKMFQDLAGYSPEEADAMREMLAKKKKAEVEKAIPLLRERLKARGWTDKQSDVFVSLCIASSAYSFNLSHSYSYGMVAYQCAFLKTNFPLEWWTSVLQNAKVEDIREKGYARTLLKQGLLVLPHVNGPTDTFELIDGKVHSPMYLIEKVGDASSAEIKRARAEGGPFLSFQDFFERVSGRGVNEAVMHNLILCGAFDLIEPGTPPQELIHNYQYFKKVSSLKIGEGKKGEDLRAAVSLYKEKEIQKGIKLSIPAMFADELQTEIMRVKALPIYKVDVHEDFGELLNSKGIVANEKGCSFGFQGDDGLVTAKVYRDLTELTRDSGRATKRDSLSAWAGFIQETSTFSYTDKKTGKKVTALKIMVTNNGETLEAVMWPNMYQEIGEPKDDKIVVVVGSLRESREPGTYSMSIQQLVYI